jgi:radical SAM protein with 4Fe4S-binding SPASM domain
MEWELFEKIIDDLSEFSEKFKKIKIGLHGEPTMHPKLPRMIEYILQKNVCETIEMFTNGSLLTPDLNYAIIKAGLQKINISVEGLTEASYKTITGFSLNYQKFIENIQNLYDNRKDLKIYIKIVDVGFSEDDKKRFYGLYGNICDEIFIEHVVPQWSHTNKFALDEVGMYGQRITKYKHVCPFVFMYLHFNHDGTVSACTLDWAKKVLIGDISRETALEIWNGENLNKLQVAMLEKKREQISLCDKCFAPMACCFEDLDDFCDEILEKIRRY